MYKHRRMQYGDGAFVHKKPDLQTLVVYCSDIYLCIVLVYKFHKTSAFYILQHRRLFTHRPDPENVYTKRKLKNKSISAFDIALAFAIIAIYTFVSAIVIAASYIGDDYYANADSIGTTYLMISAGAILISIACAIGGSVSAISRNGIRIFTSPLTYTTEATNAVPKGVPSPSPTAQNTTAAGTDTVKQPPVVPDRFASLVLSKIPFAYTAKASSNVPENTPKRTPAAEKAPEASIHTAKQLSKEPHAQISNEQSDLDMIRKMERDFQKSYKTAFSRLYNRDDCRRTFDALKKKYGDPTLPLAVHVRYGQLCEEYAPKFASPNPMGKVDHMDGHRFEKYCATVLQKNGFINVSVTPGSGDQGVDVIAEKKACAMPSSVNAILPRWGTRQCRKCAPVKVCTTAMLVL